MEIKKIKKKRIVPTGWNEFRIKDCFDTTSGSTPLSTNKSYYEDGKIPWINSGELSSPQIYKTNNYISQKGFDNSSTQMLPLNTVLVAMYGATAGKASLLKIKACTNQAICAILPNDKYDSSFIKYSIETLYDYLVSISTGSARDNLSQAVIGDLKIIVPVSFEEQKTLTCLLSFIDKKIELNRAINKNLEGMAKQLYDYWFVQFDFPDENGKPYKSSGGKMVWNEKLKREIPEGWNIVPLFDGVNVQYGFPFSTNLFIEQETNIPVVRIRDILDGSISAYSKEKIETKYQLLKGDLLIGMDGNFHMNYWHTNEAYLNQRSVRLRAKKESSISIMQVMFDLKPYIKAKEQNAKGSTVGHLSDKDLKGMSLFRVNEKSVFNPREKFDAILSIILTNRNEIENLTKQRDELLPLLMNGQVSVNSY